jgi:hypothetical protein
MLKRLVLCCGILYHMIQHRGQEQVMSPHATRPDLLLQAASIMLFNCQTCVFAVLAEQTSFTRANDKIDGKCPSSLNFSLSLYHVDKRRLSLERR